MTEAGNAIESSGIDITVAISCYNEAAFITDTIEHVINALRTTGHSYEIIVVDDLSYDGSLEKIQAYLRSHPGYPIRVVQNIVNRGRASIYFEAALLAKGRYYRLCCGDDSEPPEALVNIFKYIGVADVVVPYQHHHEVAGKNRRRKWISKTFTFLVNLVSGYHLKYYNGMAIHLRSNVIRWHPSSYGFGFEADILTRVLHEGASFVQVQRSSTDRKGSASSPINLRNTLSVSYALLKIATRRLSRFMYKQKFPKPVEMALKASDRRSDINVKC